MAVVKLDVMNNPFLNNAQYRFLYWGIWTILSVAQIFLLSYYFPVGQVVIQYDAIICNLFQAGCIVLLWYPVKYYRNSLNILLFLLFHLLLFLIASAIWMGLGFAITHTILSDNPFYPQIFLSILPMRIAFSFLTYIIFVLVYYLFLSANEIKAQELIIEEPEKLTRISVKKNHAIHLIPVGQIFYIEANGDYVMIYTAENKFMKDRTMKYWETHLPEDLFVRIHRSFIVNIECIAKIELYEKETYQIQLKNGSVLKASNAGYKLLKQRMN